MVSASTCAVSLALPRRDTDPKITTARRCFLIIIGRLIARSLQYTRCSRVQSSSSPLHQPSYPSRVGVDRDAVRPRQRDERYSRLLRNAQRHRRRRRDGNKNGNTDGCGLLHHLEAAAARNHRKPSLWVDLTPLDGSDQLVEGVVAADVFAREDDLAGRGCPCGSMYRAGLLVCQ